MEDLALLIPPQKHINSVIGSADIPCEDEKSLSYQVRIYQDVPQSGYADKPVHHITKKNLELAIKGISYRKSHIRNMARPCVPALHQVCDVAVTVEVESDVITDVTQGDILYTQLPTEEVISGLAGDEIHEDSVSPVSSEEVDAGSTRDNCKKDIDSIIEPQTEIAGEETIIESRRITQEENVLDTDVDINQTEETMDGIEICIEIFAEEELDEDCMIYEEVINENPPTEENVAITNELKESFLDKNETEELDNKKVESTNNDEEEECHIDAKPTERTNEEFENLSFSKEEENIEKEVTGSKFQESDDGNVSKKKKRSLSFSSDDDCEHTHEDIDYTDDNNNKQSCDIEKVTINQRRSSLTGDATKQQRLQRKNRKPLVVSLPVTSPDVLGGILAGIDDAFGDKKTDQKKDSQVSAPVDMDISLEKIPPVMVEQDQFSIETRVTRVSPFSWKPSSESYATAFSDEPARDPYPWEEPEQPPLVTCQDYQPPQSSIYSVERQAVPIYESQPPPFGIYPSERSSFPLFDNHPPPLVVYQTNRPDIQVYHDSQPPLERPDIRSDINGFDSQPPPPGIYPSERPDDLIIPPCPSESPSSIHPINTIDDSGVGRISDKNAQYSRQSTTFGIDSIQDSFSDLSHTRRLPEDSNMNSNDIPIERLRSIEALFLKEKNRPAPDEIKFYVYYMKKAMRMYKPKKKKVPTATLR